MAAQWQDSVVVNAGVALLDQWLMGTVLTIDRAAGGSGTVPSASLLSQTGLVSQQQDISITGAQLIEAGIKVSLHITNQDVATGYVLNQVGIWAKVDVGASALLAIYQDAIGIQIPSNAEQPDFSYTFYAVIATSNTGDLTVNIDTSALVSHGEFAAAQATLAAHIAAPVTAPDGAHGFRIDENGVPGYFDVSAWTPLIPPSGKDLLVNSNPIGQINQRLQSIYVVTSARYAMDGWIVQQGTTITMQDDGVIYLSSQGGTVVFQRLEYPGLLAGKTLTYSFEAYNQDGVESEIYMRAETSDGLKYSDFVSFNGIGVVTWTVPSNLNGTLQVTYRCVTPNVPVHLKRAKLETGTVSTLANDPPQDFGVELAKCQRYLQPLCSGSHSKVCTGQATAAALFEGVMPTFREMRINPTIQIASGSLGNLYVWGLPQGGSGITIPAASVTFTKRGNANLNVAVVPETNFTPAQFGGMLFLTSRATPVTAFLSAEL